MRLISIFLVAKATFDDVDCISMGCELVEAMAHGLGDKRTCSGVMAAVPSVDVIDDLASFLW
jgi:hypothetical protein